MSVKITLRRRSTTTEVVKGSSAVSIESTKEKFLDEVEHDASSNMIEKKSAATKRLLEAAASVCCIYDVVFRSLVEKHSLAVGENINGKVGFVFFDDLYLVRINQNRENW